MQTGYSDRINHALAFADKHHDQQVRKGLRAPYNTQPANVAIILTRYGAGDVPVLAGILHDLVASSLREGGTDDPMLERIGAKFGEAVLHAAVSVAPRTTDDDGVEFDTAERRADLLARLGAAGDDARWVFAAVALHEAGTLLADLARTEFPENVWSRLTMGRDATVRWYRQLVDRLLAVGFAGEILDELTTVVRHLEEVAAEDVERDLRAS